MLVDLLADINNYQKRLNVEESATRINEVWNIIRICKKRDLWGRIGEEHCDRIVSATLLKRDENEFEIEWSKVKVMEMLRSNAGSIDLDEEDSGIDFDKTITDEVGNG